MTCLTCEKCKRLFCGTKCPKCNPFDILLKSEYDREEVSRMFAEMINLSSMRGNSIFVESREIANIRREILYNTARALLGQDWSCCEFC